MKLSVCITTYNLENVIDETLQSVMAQKIDFDIEILIGDDGSQDGTLERIKSWKEKYPDLISCYVMPREAGVTYNSIIRASHNRLNLLKHASGEYITFLDGDDIYNTEDFYQKAVEVLEKPQNRDCALCGGSTLMYFPNGTVKPLLMSSWKSGKLSADEYWHDHYTHAEAVIMRNDIEIPDVIKKIFDDNLIVFMGLQRGSIFCLPEAVVKYRQNAKGTNYLSKPLVERCLYEIPSAEAELSVAPHMKEAILYRHRYNIATVNQYSREVTAERYPDVYAFAQDINSHALLKLFSDVQQERKTRKIRVVFLIYRPQIWMSLKSVFEACLTDDRFEVIIVAIPVVEYLTRTQIKVMSEGAEAFFKDFPCQIINGFDYEKRTFYDIHQLQPDYVFYGETHNAKLPPIYNSAVVSQYAKVCFVPYGYQVIYSEEDSVSNREFLQGCYLIFLDSSYRKNFIFEWNLRNHMLKPENIVYTGTPRFDDFGNYQIENEDSYNKTCGKTLRILWMPSGKTSYNNCNFFRFKDEIIKYTKRHLSDIELTFKAEQNMWIEFDKKGEMSSEEIQQYKEKYSDMRNASIDCEDGNVHLYGNDVLIADGVPILLDFLLLGKPVIYCHYKEDNFTIFGHEVSKAFYTADTWEEVEGYVEMLRHGYDPMRPKRLKVAKQLRNVCVGSAGTKIVEIIKRDFKYKKHDVIVLQKKEIEENKKINLYYFNGMPNFGDRLNEVICNKLFGIDVNISNPYKCEACFIGSLLDDFLSGSAKENYNKEDQPVKLWGAGFIDGINKYCKRPFGMTETFFRDIEPYAIRGKISADRVFKICNCYIPSEVIIGDPGILASCLIEGGVKKYKWGIIPHHLEIHGYGARKQPLSISDEGLFSDNMSFYIPEYEILHGLLKNSVMIDMEADPIQIINRISECQYIISAALHGLIVADALHIPSIWLKASDLLIGNEYKFNDYYSGYDKKEKSISIKEAIKMGDYGLTSEIIDKPNDWYYVDWKKEQLLGSFPF